jgi:hypothetical protein
VKSRGWLVGSLIVLTVTANITKGSCAAFYIVAGIMAVAGGLYFLFAVLPKLVDAQRRRPEDTGRQTWNDSARVDKAAEAIAEARRLRRQAHAQSDSAQPSPRPSWSPSSSGQPISSKLTSRRNDTHV